MTEEQKNLTLGQIAEMKKNLVENIKKQVEDFTNQVGCKTIKMTINANKYLKCDFDNEDQKFIVDVFDTTNIEF